jgi:hypothetical protein
MAGMQHAIIEKLRKELSCPIDTEARVVYFLVEIRKYLDHMRAAHTVTNWYLPFGKMAPCNLRWFKQPTAPSSPSLPATATTRRLNEALS